MAEKAEYSSNEPQPPHTTYEHYSGSHPIPTVQGYFQGLKERDAAEDAVKDNKNPPQSREQPGISTADLQTEDEGLHKSTGKEAQSGKTDKDIKGRTKVFDPVTGNREVEIQDASKGFLKQAGDPKVVPTGIFDFKI